MSRSTSRRSSRIIVNGPFQQGPRWCSERLRPGVHHLLGAGAGNDMNGAGDCTPVAGVLSTPPHPGRAVWMGERIEVDLVVVGGGVVGLSTAGAAPPARPDG